MVQTIKLKRTLTAGNEPASLQEGELAVTLADDPPKLLIGVPTSIDPSGMKNLLDLPVVEKIFVAGMTTNPTIGGQAFVPLSFNTTPTLNTQADSWNGITYVPSKPGYYQFEAYMPGNVTYGIFSINGAYYSIVTTSFGTQQYLTAMNYMNGTTDNIQTLVYHPIAGPQTLTATAAVRFTVYKFPS